MEGKQHSNPMDAATGPVTGESMERRMRGNTHVRCGERAGETGREKSRYRAPARLSIVGTGSASAIVTLVERSTRFVMLGHLPTGHSAEEVRDVLVPLIKSLPERLRGTLAWDQGTEMAAHRQIGVAAGVQVYFCDPHSPW